MKYLLILFIFCACNPSRKAQKAENKLNDIAVKYPLLLAKKARDLYPCVNTSDTIYTSNDSAFQQALLDITEELTNQTLINDSLNRVISEAEHIEPGLDSVCLNYIKAINLLRKQKDDLAFRLKNIPPVHDTVWIPPVEDFAKVKLCEEDKSKVIGLLEKKTAEYDKVKGQAQKRGWIMWGLILLIISIIGLNVWKAIKLKK